MRLQSTSVAGVLCISLVLCQDFDALIQRLETPEAADTAATIGRTGGAGLPALEKAAAAAKLSPKAKALLDGALLSARTRLVVPMPRRMNVVVVDEPILVALDTVLVPYGIEHSVWRIFHEEAIRRRISLDLKDAGFWKAYDAVFEAAGMPPPLSDRYSRVHLTPFRPTIATCDYGEIRFVADVGVYGTRDERHGNMIITPRVLFPPGSVPTAALCRDIVFRDPRQKAIKPEQRGRRDDRTSTIQGGIPTMQVGEFILKREDIAGSETVGVEGAVTLTCPAEVERVEIPLKGGRKTKLAGCPVELVTAEYSPDGCESEMTWEAAKGRDLTYHGWVVDAGGNRLIDLRPLTIVPGHPGRWRDRATGLRVPGAAAAVVFVRYEGVHYVTIPFRIDDIRVPDVP